MADVWDILFALVVLAILGVGIYVAWRQGLFGGGTSGVSDGSIWLLGSTPNGVSTIDPSDVDALASKVSGLRLATEAEMTFFASKNWALCGCGWYKASDGSVKQGFVSMDSAQASASVNPACRVGRKLIECTPSTPMRTTGGTVAFLHLPNKPEAQFQTDMETARAAGYVMLPVFVDNKIVWKL